MEAPFLIKITEIDGRIWPLNRLQKYCKIRRILDTTRYISLFISRFKVKCLQLICRKGAYIVQVRMYLGEEGAAGKVPARQPNAVHRLQRQNQRFHFFGWVNVLSYSKIVPIYVKIKLSERKMSQIWMLTRSSERIFNLMHYIGIIR